MAEFKIKDKQTGEVFTIREKAQAPQATQPTQEPSNKTLGARAKEGFVNVGLNALSSMVPKNAGDIQPQVNIGGGFQNPGSLGSRVFSSAGGEAAKSLTQSKNPIANFAMDIAFDPMTYMGAGAGSEAAAKAMAPRAGKLMMQSKKALNEAEKLATQILQPTTSDLSEAIAKGKQLPSIKRGAESISSARTFEDVVKQLRTTTKDLFDERRMILEQNNVPVGGQALEALSEVASKANKDMVLSPSKLKQFDNVFYREAEFLEKNPVMDVVTAQARKEALQDLTRPLLEKRRAGTLTGSENVELQAYDALRQGYRNAILKALPKDKATIVDKINSKYEGLLDATELASSQAARGIKEVPKSLLEKVAASFGLSPKFTAFRLATKELAGLTGKTRLERTTTKIMELRNKSETLRQLARLAKKANK